MLCLKVSENLEWHANLRKKAGILRAKTMADKLMYNPNDDTQN